MKRTWLGGADMTYGAGKGFVKGEGCRCAHRFKLNPAFFSTTASSGNRHQDSVIAASSYVEYAEPLFGSRFSSP